MDADQLRELLKSVAEKRESVEAAVQKLRHMPFADLDFAKVDHHRAVRSGFAEVVYCPGKTCDQIRSIVRELRAHQPCVLASRADPTVQVALREDFPDAEIHPRARAVIIGTPRTRSEAREIPIVTAGTSDLPVAEEALVTLRALGGKGHILADVGVSGIHRLLAKAEELQGAPCLIVVAGMEGALPSVVGGIVSCPVIAVPTSVGYGANLGGIAALLAMLNSCASNVAVVNIDSGFKAAYVAACIDFSRTAI